MELETLFLVVLIIAIAWLFKAGSGQGNAYVKYERDDPYHSKL